MSTIAQDQNAQPLEMGFVVLLPDGWLGELRAETKQSQAAIVDTVSTCGRYIACYCRAKKGAALRRHVFEAEKLTRLMGWKGVRKFAPKLESKNGGWYLVADN